MDIDIVKLISNGDIGFLSWDYIPKELKKHNKFCFVCSYCMGNLQVYGMSFSHQMAIIRIEVCGKCRDYIDSIVKMPLCECIACVEMRKKRPYYNKNHLKHLQDSNILEKVKEVVNSFVDIEKGEKKSNSIGPED